MSIRYAYLASDGFAVRPLAAATAEIVSYTHVQLVVSDLDFIDAPNHVRFFNFYKYFLATRMSAAKLSVRTSRVDGKATAHTKSL